MNKRGLTPIASTMILLGFALLIGMVVMYLSEDYLVSAAASKSGKTKSVCGQKEIAQMTANGELTSQEAQKVEAILRGCI